MSRSAVGPNALRWIPLPYMCLHNVPEYVIGYSPQVDEGIPIEYLDGGAPREVCETTRRSLRHDAASWSDVLLAEYYGQQVEGE